MVLKVGQNKDILVIFHAECPDGFGSAYSAWKKFGDSADYFPAFYDTEPPEVAGKDVYIIDYSYTKEKLSEIKKSARRLTMIDHHKSNEDLLKIADEFVFDINHSASVLSWNFFNPDKDIPKFLLYVEEGDLWSFKLPHSKEVAAFIDDLRRDFHLWDSVISEFENREKRDVFVKKGEDIIREIREFVFEKVSSAREVIFEGYKTLIVNSERYSSEIGNILSKKLPPIGLIWKRENDKISVSLRSDGSVDVAKLAEKYGGGGHKNAAGFVLADENELKRCLKCNFDLLD